MMADLEIPTRVILQQLASAIKLVVQVSRLQDGTRKVLSVSEVLGVKDEKVDLQEIFTFERIGVTDAGKVQGRFRATGVTPKIWTACASAASPCRRPFSKKSSP